MHSRKVDLSPKELRQLQLNILEILIEVDRICREHDIKYSLDGGTLLGAVRHDGFIPWDDDIDIIMRREEYEKFAKVCETELDEKRFFLQDYRTDAGYRWGYEKVRRKNTEFVRLGQEHLKNKTGVFLDIFVVDNVPDGWWTRRIHYVFCFVIRKLLYAEVGRKTEKKAFWRGWFELCYRLFPRDVIFSWRDWVAERCNKKRTELVSHMTHSYPKRTKFGMPAVCFDEMMDIGFEGYQFRCFKEYDRYLSLLFGDYHTLPPKEERVMHLEASSISLLPLEELYTKEELLKLGWIEKN